MYNKQVNLTPDEIKEYQKLLLYHGNAEGRMENELESIKVNFNAQIKSKNAEISAAKAERVKYQDYLSQGYRFREVPSATYLDADLKMKIVIQTDNLELLEAINLSDYNNPDLGFDNYNVVVADKDKFEEMMIAYPEIFSIFPDVLVIDDNITLFVFKTDRDMRVLRLSGDLNSELLVSLIQNFQDNGFDEDAEVADVAEKALQAVKDEEESKKIITHQTFVTEVEVDEEADEFDFDMKPKPEIPLKQQSYVAVTQEPEDDDEDED
jgi:hypothetical protein